MLPMADQGRWFKLWASAPSDEDVQRLPPAHRWAWAVFGVYTKVHGKRGSVTVSSANHALAGEMSVPNEELLSVIQTFPHMTFEESEKSSRCLTVTWNNWHKYQEDTTMARRQQVSRSKRRGEEKRREPPLPASSQLSEAFVETLKNNPAYKGIEIDRELHRMDAWLATPANRKRKKTQRFVVNWLNRIDVALPPGTSQAKRLWDEAQREKDEARP